MTKRAALLLVLPLLGPGAATASAQRIFADGFEPPCVSTDTDGDRLNGCQEAAAQTATNNPDTDGDGIGDGDEVLGTLGGLDLPAMGVDPRRKDILLEYDWFDDSAEGGVGLCPASTVHSHRPTDAMLEIVSVMFGAAPVGNPNGVPGINVIHDKGQGGAFIGGNVVPDTDGLVEGNVFGSNYEAIYNAHFASNRRSYFHYVLMPHRYQAADGSTGSSGYAEIFGGQYTDRMMVSLYCVGTEHRVGNTIAHELGHNLRLNHGGSPANSCNMKPNYNSIMNYKYQFDGVDNDCDIWTFPGQPPDFSRGTRLTINENAVVEAVGMCGSPIDWNFNGSTADVLSTNLNSYEKELSECGALKTELTDHDDWGNIVIPITDPGLGGGGLGDDDAVPVGADCPAPLP